MCTHLRQGRNVVRCTSVDAFSLKTNTNLLDHFIILPLYERYCYLSKLHVKYVHGGSFNVGRSTTSNLRARTSERDRLEVPQHEPMYYPTQVSSGYELLSGQDVGTILGDQHSVFELGRSPLIHHHRRPPVLQHFDVDISLR